ncbi:unnamed protein product [Rhizophagus irregularis]|uniref:Aerolysin-like C-terminal domain-containing protein n=1 Tax=Rhizophagus irregularis TaxID=588596 RepID=A0A2I1GPQ3_9GLOM|nr:hypothetical protein RhiirA4_525429 [Rhizophagus irregularis]CAB4442510.1 unnamed protein product [Rhizophagus irregularis]CAB4442595.1 unnamed protein product [Rhizophagus irregularis]
MELYIPPKGLKFRLQNYKSKWAIVSKFSPDPQLFHFTSSDEFNDQYWTLIPGTGKHSGYFRIENCVTQQAIYSRFSQEPKFFTYTSSEFDDQYWIFVPGTGKRSGYFRIENYVTKWAIFSRFSQEPQLSHYISSDQFDDQYWSFIFEDMIIESVDYKIDVGKIQSTKNVVLMRQSLTNDTDGEQMLSLKVDESVKHTSTFEYLGGFTVKVGAKFKAEIPFIEETGLNIEATTGNHTWSFGNSTESVKKYTAELSVKVLPRTKIIVEVTIKKSILNVPFIMHLKSKETGIKVDTYGTYSGVTTWDFNNIIREQKINPTC